MGGQHKYYHPPLVPKRPYRRAFTEEEKYLIAKDYQDNKQVLGILELKWKTSRNSIKKIADSLGISPRGKKRMPKMELRSSC